jgi:hypothetical protein
LRAGWRFLLFPLGVILGVRLVEEPLSRFLAQRLTINLNELSAPPMLIRKFVLSVSVFLNLTRGLKFAILKSKDKKRRLVWQKYDDNCHCCHLLGLRR